MTRYASTSPQVRSPGCRPDRPGGRHPALDPAQLPLPPGGIATQGNAYRIAVAYVPSGATATAVQPVDVTLRYPVDATLVILLAGGAWQTLPTTLESAALAVDATTTEFGVFAAAGTGATPPGPDGPRHGPMPQPGRPCLPQASRACRPPAIPGAGGKEDGQATGRVIVAPRASASAVVPATLKL